MEARQEQGTGTRELIDDGRDREAPVGTDDVGARPADHAVAAGDDVALLPAGEGTALRTRWEELQTGFVDEPRRTVEQADELVAEVMRRLAEGFAREREELRGPVGSRRGRLHRGPPRGAAALPGVLPAVARGLSDELRPLASR